MFQCHSVHFVAFTLGPSEVALVENSSSALSVLLISRSLSLSRVSRRTSERASSSSTIKSFGLTPIQELSRDPQNYSHRVVVYLGTSGPERYCSLGLFLGYSR